VLTRRGVLLLTGAFTLVLLGRVLGLADLYVLAAAGGLAVAAAFVYVRMVQFPLADRRRVTPPRVHLGAPCRVDLELTNTSDRRIPSLRAEEPFGASGVVAEFVVPEMDPGQSGRAAYQVPTGRRGRYVLGPLTLRLEDPFGLARAQRQGGAAGAVLVYPRMEAMPGMPPAPGHDPHDGTVTRTARSQGEDFFALRPYEVGDDLRRVHWPSTARSDELMIRQVELPWQHRTTIVLDTRRQVHDAASFELAVSAAASILSGSQRAGAITRLVTPGGLDSGFASGAGHREAALASLAAVEPSGPASLPALLAARRAHGAGASVAVVTTTAIGPAERAAVSGLRERAGLVVLVLIERLADDGQEVQGGGSGTAAGPAARAGRGQNGITAGPAGVFRVVTVSETRPLADAWSADPVLAGQGRRSGRRPLSRLEPVD